MAENEKNKKGKASTNRTTKTSSNKNSTKKTSTAKKTTTSKTAKKTAPKKTTAAKKTTDSKKVSETEVKVGEVKEQVKPKKETKKQKEKKEKKENIKQARKQLYYNENNDSNELSKLIKIVLIVTAIIVVFYGVTVVVTNKAKEAAEEENKEATEIQYDSIVIGSMLNINGTFYVLIEDEDDIRLNEYTTLIQTISASEDAPKIYTADLSSSFNEHYFSDKTNYDSDMSKFRVKGTTLVRVSDHEITDVFDNHDSIVDELNDLDEVK